VIPKYHEIMRPLLESLQDGDASTAESTQRMARHFELSEDEIEERIPSGQEGRFFNRVSWARTYLKKAGLLIYPERGVSSITEKGREFLASHQGPIAARDLKQFASFVEFQTKSSDSDQERDATPPDHDADTTPEEQIFEAYETINQQLAADLIERVQAKSPAFFERLLVDLLVAMGYGGSSEEAGRDLGKSGDGGVDGVIDQDVLGVDQIYIQAKRYADGNTVGSGAIRDFFGALNIKRASKGIFFTTSTFTKSAKETAEALGTRIVLIDGEQLARLMIRYGIGCRVNTVVTLRKIDEDFFDNV
jgi:restriction system protein